MGKLFATARLSKPESSPKPASSSKSARLGSERPKSRKGNKVRSRDKVSSRDKASASLHPCLEMVLMEMEELVTAVAICGLTRVCRLLTPETHDAKQHPALTCGPEEWHPAAPRKMPIMPNTLAGVLKIAKTAGLKAEKMLTCGGTDFRARVTPFSLCGTFTMHYSGTAPEHEVYAAVFCCVAQHLMSDSVIDDLHLSGSIGGMTAAGMHIPSVLRRMYEIAAAHRKHTLVHGFSSIVPLLHFSTAPVSPATELSAEYPSL